MERARSIAFRSVGGRFVELDDVAAYLAADGIVLFTRARRAPLTDALASWTVACAHPHDNGDALTVIEPRASASTPGSSGFSREAVAPHTDRALVTQPPALAAVLVERPASSGGQNLLVDLKADRWFRLLAHSRPMESGPWLRAADGTRWPVVETSRNLVRVRFP